LARTKEYEASYAEYDQAIRINPQLAVAYVQAGSLAEQLNDFDRALKYYSSGSKQLNENQDLLLAQADLLLKMKKWEDARLLVEKALRIDANNAAAIWRMGEYYRLQGQNAEATREYTRALAIDPKLPEAHMGLGTLASQRGMYDEARKQFQMVVNNPQAPQELKDQATKQLRSLAGK
jgi:tetratricopeptide (TPR) repeat protein